MPTSITDILKAIEDRYYDLFYNRFKGFCIRYRSDISNAYFKGNKLSDIDIDDLGFVTYHFFNDGDAGIAIKILATPEISADIYLGHGDVERESTHKCYLSCTCKMTVLPTPSNFKIVSVDFYEGKERNENVLDDNLVPFLNREKCAQIVDEILSKYYPESSEEYTPVDIRCLASRMGLKIMERSINKERSIFGQFYFEDSIATFYDSTKDENYQESIPANTIVIDHDANYLYSYGSENITIAHECIHAYCHRKALTMLNFLSKKIGCISCETNLSSASHQSAIDWMETQANLMAPILVLPDEKLHKYVQQWLLENTEGDPLVDTTSLIYDVADTFGITRYAARKRLIDIGYEQAVGCLNWVDNHYARSYLFQKGSLAPNKTFTISTESFLKFVDSFCNQQYDIFSKIVNGTLVFVENHLILNNEKYVEYGDQLLLTEYARRNLNECAIQFQLFKGNAHIVSGIELQNYLCRDSNLSLSYTLAVNGKQVAFDSPEFRKCLEQQQAEEKQYQLICAQSDNIAEVLKALLEIKKITIQDWAINSGYSRRTISRFLSGDAEIKNRETLLALLIGLGITSPKPIEMFFNKAGFTLNGSMRERYILAALVADPRADVESLNAKLASVNLEPIKIISDKSET